MVLLLKLLILLILFCQPCFSQNTQFSDAAINQKVLEIKRKIAARQNQNQQTIEAAFGPNDPEFHRASTEEKNRDTNDICEKNTIKSQLTDAIQRACIPKDLYYTCESYQEESRRRAQSIMAQMTSVNTGMVGTLQSFQETLESALRTTIKYNDMCSSQVANKLFGNECRDAYEEVLHGEIENRLASSCSEYAIDRTVQEFKNAMQTIYVKSIDDLQENHVKAREIEGEIVKIILKVRTQLKNLKQSEQIETAGLSK